MVVRLKGFKHGKLPVFLAIFAFMVILTAVFAEKVGDADIQSSNGFLSGMELHPDNDESFGGGTSPQPCSPPDCDDGNPCTLDKCVNGVCSNAGDASLSGVSCTVNGKAGTCNASGECVEKTAPPASGCTGDSDCDDGNPCTNNVCDTSTGECSRSNVADGTSCGDNKECSNGKCVDKTTPPNTSTCIKCAPEIVSIVDSSGNSFGSNNKLLRGKQIKVKVDLGGCNASKLVLSVISRNFDNYNLYWGVFGYPGREEFLSVDEAFQSLEDRGARIESNKFSEPYTLMDFREYAVDAVVKEGSYTGTVEIPLDFSEKTLDPLFKAERNWFEDNAQALKSQINGLNDDDVTSIPDAGFFEPPRGLDTGFQGTMGFKVEAKDSCGDWKWRISGLRDVPFEDKIVTPGPSGCTGDSGCDDGNPCTVDKCVNGQCSHSNVADGTDCGSGNVCRNGVCVHSGTAPKECNPPDCDDGNPCTNDTCDTSTGECSHSNVADGTACGDNKECSNGECVEKEIPDSGGSQSGGGCFIEVEAVYDGKTFNAGETAQVDPSAPLSVDGKFSLSQQGCEIESGEYGFWGTKTFSGGKAAGSTLNYDQLNKMSNGENVTVSGISISDLSGYENSTLYFGLKGSVKKAGADSFEQANSMWVGFEVGQGGETVTPPPEEGGEEGETQGETGSEPAGPIAGCDPCLSITGCLACLDEGLVDSSFR